MTLQSDRHALLVARTPGAVDVSANAAGLRAGSVGLSRDVFLDAVRTLALLRVVLWHATGAVALTYFVAAVPMMFFVAGSLLAKSFRRGVLVVVRDRVQRILVPLWAFALAAYATMYIAFLQDGTTKTEVPWRRLVFWIVPVADPKGSQWEGGYMSAPLWYMRALLWLIVLSPMLLWLVRRTGGVAVAVSASAVFALDALDRHELWRGTWAWRIGDLALYATFVMLGFVHRDGGLDWITRRRWLLGAGLGGATAALWCVTQPVPGNVVNDSHPAHLLVGFAWLCVFFAARPLIERVATSRAGGAAINLVSQRSITIYLWRSTAVIVSFELLRRLGVDFPAGGWTVALLILTALVTSLFVLCFGWIEDTANHRVRHAWPVPKYASSAAHAHRFASAAAVLGALVVAATGNLTLVERRTEASPVPAGVRLRVPSRAPAVPVAAVAQTTLRFDSAAPLAGPHDFTVAEQLDTTEQPIVSPADLAALVDAWVRDNAAAGVQIAIYRTGSIDWQYAVGVEPESGTSLTADGRFDIESITKTFTAALVWQQIDRNAIDPDAPLPRLVAVPNFRYLQITPRQLLTHRSGLVNYRDTPEFATDPGSVTPLKALNATARQPLAFVPGTQVDYSSSNYLVLGFLLEQVTGQRYDTLLAELIAQARLGTIPHRAPAPGRPNFSTAGLAPTAAELARWSIALLRDNTPGLSPSSLAAMRAVNPATGFGAGLIGYCPCADGPDGLQFSAFGHTGGYSEVQYFPATDLAIALNVSDSIYVPDNRYDAVQSLIVRLHNLVVTGR